MSWPFNSACYSGRQIKELDASQKVGLVVPQRCWTKLGRSWRIFIGHWGDSSRHSIYNPQSNSNHDLGNPLRQHLLHPRNHLSHRCPIPRFGIRKHPGNTHDGTQSVRTLGSLYSNPSIANCWIQQRRHRAIYPPSSNRSPHLSQSNRRRKRRRQQLPDNTRNPDSRSRLEDRSIPRSILWRRDD